MAAINITNQRIIAQVSLAALVYGVSPEEYIDVILARDVDALLAETADRVFRPCDSVENFQRMLGRLGSAQ